jgi:hypothetical protein
MMLEMALGASMPKCSALCRFGRCKAEVLSAQGKFFPAQTCVADHLDSTNHVMMMTHPTVLLLKSHIKALQHRLTMKAR